MPKLFKEAGFPAEPGKAPSAKKKNDSREKQSKYKYLDTYCRNLTKRAADGKLDRIVGREKELDRVIQILCRRQKNNPCLIGEPGVGKTAIAEALAQKRGLNRRADSMVFLATKSAHPANFINSVAGLP